MMTAESMLSKRLVLRIITVAPFFLLKLPLCMISKSESLLSKFQEMNYFLKLSQS